MWTTSQDSHDLSFYLIKIKLTQKYFVEKLKEKQDTLFLKFFVIMVKNSKKKPLKNYVIKMGTLKISHLLYHPRKIVQQKGKIVRYRTQPELSCLFAAAVSTIGNILILLGPYRRKLHINYRAVRNPIFAIFIPSDANVSFITIVRKILVSLIQGVMKVYSWDRHLQSCLQVFNKRNLSIQESGF